MTSRRPRLTPRALHPVAWWLWALGLAAAATRTTNPLLLLTIVTVAWLVVAARRAHGPWGRAFHGFLVLGVVVLAVRLLFEVLFGAPVPGTVVVTLPELQLPEWMAGVRIGGEVTVEGLVGAFYSGLQLVALLACVGAANALVTPARLLKVVPGALYEVGVAVVVGLSVAPQTLAHSRRVREARRLRGRSDRGLRAVVAVAMPVLEGALDRSLAVAAAMDCRGFGRARHVPMAERRVTALLVLAGLTASTVGGYALLDVGTPGWQGLGGMIVGTAIALTGLHRAGRRAVRTVYRPDPWRWPETLTAGLGLGAAVVTIAVSVAAGPGAAALAPTTVPLVWPTVPVLPWLAVLAAALPAALTPAPPPAEGARPTPLADVTADPAPTRPRREVAA